MTTTGFLHTLIVKSVHGAYSWFSLGKVTRKRLGAGDMLSDGRTDGFRRCFLLGSFGMCRLGWVEAGWLAGVHVYVTVLFFELKLSPFMKHFFCRHGYYPPSHSTLLAVPFLWLMSACVSWHFGSSLGRM